MFVLLQSEPNGEKRIADAPWLCSHPCQLRPGMLASYFPARPVIQCFVTLCMHARHGWVWSCNSHSRKICSAWAPTAHCSHRQHRHGNLGMVFELGHGPGHSQAHFTGIIITTEWRVNFPPYSISWNQGSTEIQYRPGLTNQLPAFYYAITR